MSRAGAGFLAGEGRGLVGGGVQDWMAGERVGRGYIEEGTLTCVTCWSWRSERLVALRGFLAREGVGRGTWRRGRLLRPYEHVWPYPHIIRKYGIFRFEKVFKLPFAMLIRKSSLRKQKLASTCWKMVSF